MWKTWRTWIVRLSIGRIQTGRCSTRKSSLRGGDKVTERMARESSASLRKGERRRPEVSGLQSESQCLASFRLGPFIASNCP
uniref:Secreted protein n=1 Tax=Steinernema glaseri TaxID=37863 RepID=A0A1I7ZXV6_9BILA